MGVAVPSRCKHVAGTISEELVLYSEYDVEDGKREDLAIHSNAFPTGRWIFDCRDCGRSFSTTRVHKSPLWLQRYVEGRLG